MLPWEMIGLPNLKGPNGTLLLSQSTFLLTLQLFSLVVS